jgi:hypothetical protein
VTTLSRRAAEIWQIEENTFSLTPLIKVKLASLIQVKVVECGNITDEEFVAESDPKTVAAKIMLEIDYLTDPRWNR